MIVFRRGVSLEYASTNTPQQIGMSERVGRTLAAMVRCMLDDSGLPKFFWGEFVYGCVPGEKSATFRDRHAVPVQGATRNRAGSSASSSRRCQGLRPHREALPNARRQSSGRTIGGIYQQQQELPRLQSSDPAHHGEQKHHLHRDAAATSSATVGGITYAASSVEQRNGHLQLHHRR